MNEPKVVESLIGFQRPADVLEPVCVNEPKVVESLDRMGKDGLSRIWDRRPSLCSAS